MYNNITGRRDILGAAETGSGKTLAFGIPILAGIMKLKEQEKSGQDIYDIPYKKTSVKQKHIKVPADKIKKKRSNHNNKKKKVESDGYSSGSEDDSNDISNDLNNDCNINEEYEKEIEVPIKKRDDTSVDEGNDSDSDNYVHLSDLIDDEDSSDSDENDNVVNTEEDCDNDENDNDVNTEDGSNNDENDNENNEEGNLI